MKKRIYITVMVFTMLFGLFGCAGNAKKVITSVEEMTLTLRGMRGSYVYKIVCESDKPELRLYREVFSGEDTILELEKKAVPDTQVILDLMNSCGILRWDGFHGKHPKNVQDGIMFTFSAAVNGGQTIRADGSANFPKGYHEFIRTLNAILSGCEND